MPRFRCTVVYQALDGSQRTRTYPWTGTQPIPPRMIFAGTPFELVATVRTDRPAPAERLQEVA